MMIAAMVNQLNCMGEFSFGEGSKDSRLIYLVPRRCKAELQAQGSTSNVQRPLFQSVRPADE